MAPATVPEQGLYEKISGVYKMSDGSMMEVLPQRG